MSYTCRGNTTCVHVHVYITIVLIDVKAVYNECTQCF